MASFKRLKKSDIISAPYVANKNWTFSYSPLPQNDENVVIYKGTNVTGSFSTILDPVTEGQYERLVYDQINHLFYQQYSDQDKVLNTSSLEDSLYYDALSQIRATGSYFNYNENPGLIKTFPTGAMEGIRVLSINKKLYGEQIQPYIFQLSSSAYLIKDDGIGNLYDEDNSNIHVGNIFYSHGLVIITNQDYQLMFPTAPVAGYKSVTYLDTDTSRTIDLTNSINWGNNTSDNTSLVIPSTLGYAYFTNNGDGTVSFDNGITAVGLYQMNFTFYTTVGSSTLTSNYGLLDVNIIANPSFNVSIVEFF